MEHPPKRNFVWIYIFTGVLAVLGVLGVARGDWISGGYILGAIGMVIWIYGTRRRGKGAVRVGLILAGAGVTILLFDMVRELLV